MSAHWPANADPAYLESVFERICTKCWLCCDAGDDTQRGGPKRRVLEELQKVYWAGQKRERETWAGGLFDDSRATA